MLFRNGLINVCWTDCESVFSLIIIIQIQFFVFFREQWHAIAKTSNLSSLARNICHIIHRNRQKWQNGDRFNEAAFSSGDRPFGCSMRTLLTSAWQLHEEEIFERAPETMHTFFLRKRKSLGWAVSNFKCSRILLEHVFIDRRDRTPESEGIYQRPTDCCRRANIRSLRRHRRSVRGRAQPPAQTAGRHLSTWNQTTQDRLV